MAKLLKTMPKKVVGAHVEYKYEKSRNRPLWSISIHTEECHCTVAFYMEIVGFQFH